MEPLVTHKNVYMALAAAQAEMGAAKKSAENPHFRSKYADLAEIVEVAKPPLTKHGLCFFHVLEASDLGRFMVTILAHGESGTEIRCPVELLLQKTDMQGYKSATTYAKRIGLESVTGIAPEDDDGNAAVASTPNASARGLQDAWRDGVMDSLPENATPRQKAEAFADAIVAEFASKGEKALSNAWDRRKKLIDEMETRHPDLHEKIVDAFMTRQEELEDPKREKAGDSIPY